MIRSILLDRNVVWRQTPGDHLQDLSTWEDNGKLMPGQVCPGLTIGVGDGFAKQE